MISIASSDRQIPVLNLLAAEFVRRGAYLLQMLQICSGLGRSGREAKQISTSSTFVIVMIVTRQATDPGAKSWSPTREGSA